MAPILPFTDPVMDIDFGFDEEDTSLVRPSDVGLYEHGVASRYQDKGMLLSEQQAKAEDNAMKYLMESMNKQAEVSPEQMLATALLNIIPTAGGYLIGKSVGEPELPPGYFEAGGTRAALGKGVYGAEAGALMGLEGGSNAAQGYLKALEGDQEQKNKVYGAMATVENQRASRLGQEADQYKQAAINTQSKIDLALDPTLRNAEVEDARRIADAQAGARSKYDSSDDLVSPETAAYYASKTGADPSQIRTQQDINRAIALKKEEGIGNRQQKRWEREDLKTNVFGLQKLPGVLPDERDQKEAQLALKNYETLATIHIPELKAVFSDPNTTLDKQQQALKGVIVAIKDQQKMGANFTAMEKELVNAGLPKIAELDVWSLMDYMKASLQGQDALAKIDRLGYITEQAAKIGMEPYGYTFGKGGTENLGSGGDLSARKAELKAAIAAEKAKRGIQ